MRHSLDWWSDWSRGCSESFPLAGTPSSVQMPPAQRVLRASRLACTRVCPCFHVCSVVNPPVRLCAASCRGQSKECKRVGQPGHQRANRSFMDFPVKDAQAGSPSSRCGSRSEVFLGLSVSNEVVEALGSTTLKLRDCQKTLKRKELMQNPRCWL